MLTLRTATRWCLCLFLVSATTFAKDYTDVPWHKLKATKIPVELHSRALELRDYANAGDVRYIYYALHAAHFGKRQVRQIQERLRKPDDSHFTHTELAEISQRLYTSLETQFDDLFSDTYTWQFVHHRKYRKRHFLLYRIESSEGAYDYIDFEFLQQNHQWLLIDWYTRSTDTWISAVFSRSFQLAFNAQQHPGRVSQNLLSFINPENRDLMARFDALTARQKQDPMLQAFLVGHTSRYFPEKTGEANQRLSEWAAPNKFLIFKFNHAYEHNNFRLALQLSEQLQTQLGQDENLALMQAELLYQLGETRRADKLVANSIRRYPDSQKLFYTTLMLFGYYQKYPQAVLVLDILKSEFDLLLDEEALQNISGLEDFVASAEYKNWLSR